MKRKLSKLSIKKTAIASFSANKVKGGSVLCAFTEDNSCQDTCNPTINLACTFGCDTNWC